MHRQIMITFNDKSLPVKAIFAWYVVGVICLKTQNGNAFSSRLAPPSLKGREVYRLSRVAIVARLNFSLDILETSLYTRNKSFAGLVFGPSKKGLRTNKSTDRWTGEASDGPTDGPMDGRTLL